MIKKFFFIIFSFFFLIPNLFAEEAMSLKKQNWSFEGIFGRYDNSTLQRGLQIYQEVCSACHGMKRLRFRELKDLGFTNDQIEKYAETFEILDGPNELGEMFIRTGKPSDTFVSPFKNKEEAIKLANSTKYGLGCSIWTSNLSVAHSVAQKIDSGIIWINDHHKNDPSSPWGGLTKESGIGRENGIDSYREYTQTKSIIVNCDEYKSDWFGDITTRYS